MVQIEQVQSPSKEQYREAHRLCATHWTHLDSLDLDARFALFEHLAVELVLARDGQKLLGVCFVLPDSVSSASGILPVVWLFNLYVLPESQNLGALMLMRMMHWYSPIMCIGVTAQAGQIYRALRWQCFEQVWRCVHPINLSAAVSQFGQNVSAGWLRVILRMAGVIYNPLMRVLDHLLSMGIGAQNVEGLDLDRAPQKLPQNSVERSALVATYLMAFETAGLMAVEIGGIGRLVRDDLNGLQRVREHARLRRALRKQGVVMTEFIASSVSDKKRALWCGAMPISMPIYYWDPDDLLAGFFAEFDRSDFTFASCDKIF